MLPVIRLILVLSILVSLNLRSQTSKDSLDASLSEIVDQSKLPGFAVAIIKRDSIVYREGFGYSDLATKTPFTTNTVQTIASISKTTIGISVTQLIEKGELSLATEINDLLPFTVDNPHHPDIPITIQHLATHTSGIIDGEFSENNLLISDSAFFSDRANNSEDYAYLRKYVDNVPISMSKYLSNALAVEGAWYSRNNFSPTKPGERYEYSNTAAALLAYIVELKTGLTFSEYTKKEIMEPLGMDSSSWTCDKLLGPSYATLYSVRQNPLPVYRSVTYPDGDLLSNVTDLSRLFREVIKGFYGDDTDLLTSASVKSMLSPHVPQSALPESYQDHQGNYGILWQINPRGAIGHTGSTPGAFTYMFFDPNTGIGRIFITNITATQDDELLNAAITAIRTLGRYAGKL